MKFIIILLLLFSKTLFASSANIYTYKKTNILKSKYCNYKHATIFNIDKPQNSCQSAKIVVCPTKNNPDQLVSYLVLEKRNFKIKIDEYPIEGTPPTIEKVFLFEKNNKFQLLVLISWKHYLPNTAEGKVYKIYVYGLTNNCAIKKIEGIFDYEFDGLQDGENKKAFFTKKLNISKKLESISDLKSILKSIKKKSEITLVDIPTIHELLFFNPLSIKTLTTYNNIAYYLQKAGANEEAVYLLEKIIKKFPNRTVAYYNLGDAYWALGEKKKAIKAYTTYIEQMCHKGLQKRIPKVVLERVSSKK